MDYEGLKKTLADFVKKKADDKESEQANREYVRSVLADFVKKKAEDKANAESERQTKNDQDRNKILENIASDLSVSLKPVIAGLVDNLKLSSKDIQKAIADATNTEVTNSLLKQLVEKENNEIDLSSTNKLLLKVLAELEKGQDVRVTVKLV